MSQHRLTVLIMIIFVLTLCVAFPPVSYAGSIEQERMQEGIRQEQEEQQKQREQQVNEYNKAVDEAREQTDSQKKGVYYLNVPEGYYVCPKSGKLYPIKK